MTILLLKPRDSLYIIASYRSLFIFFFFMIGLLMNAWINQNRAVVMWISSLFCLAPTVLNYFYNFYYLCVVNAL